MTGLNLESFLHLLRADVGAWATLALIALILALMAWTSWGTRRALRKCLVLSVIAHFGLALFGGTGPTFLLATHTDDDQTPRERIRQIKVLPTAEPAELRENGARSVGPAARWDKPIGGLALADTRLSAPKVAPAPDVAVRPGDRAELKTVAAAPETPAPALSAPESRPADPAPAEPTPDPTRATPGGEDDIAPAVVAPRIDPAPSGFSDRRLRPERTRPDPAPPPAEPRRPASSLTALPVTETPAPSAPELVAARGNEPPAVAGVAESVPPVAAAAPVGTDDVAAVDVIPARPDSPRLSAGKTDLRTRSRPATGPGVAGSSASPRSPLTTGLSPTPTLEVAAANGPKVLAERPAGAPAETAVETRPAAPGEGEMAAAVVKEAVSPLPRVAAPESDVRRRSRPSAVPATAAEVDRTGARSRPAAMAPLALARVTPSGVPALPEIRGATGGRPLNDVPEVYRSRLDPNRSALAYRAGASPASEQAVERALDWLARHQDIDGRWDGGTSKFPDGTALKGDDDYTVHCPPGETCFGECAYWEADTALTGLALLSYLGAGYTQTDGKYAETVARGLDFLLGVQKPDGDLRGASKAVGMYCHAMATIALCEAYALTGDERLRNPVERAVAFLVRSRAKDGLSWRYAPGAPIGDTSILGWVVMALKSAREVGIAIPANTQAGIVTWLSKVASGDSKGLARYLPTDPITETMTAEAWACRQFLGVGGPGAASSESARFLLAHGPRTGTYNLYYWYYGTLAMYQHGGDAWYRWNGQVRDEITRRQVVSGHTAGSWAPDDTSYGALGGRIYSTALATLSLEVYYRYLRLYDAPTIPPAVAPRPRGGDRDPALGRLGTAGQAGRARAAGTPKR